MIGVVASAAQERVIREFFNLFKTPWEFCQPGAAYDVIICSNSQRADNSAPLVLVYGASRGAFDCETEIQVRGQRHDAILSYHGERMPIYGGCLILSGPGEDVLQTEDRETLAIEFALAGGAVVRVGFDLFGEVEQLLKRGQPQEHARIPTLDLQIALLRDLIVSHGIPLFEIPPVPAGYNFIVCLTHDVDHPRISYHRGDHTMFGFLYRATLRSFFEFCARRRPFRQLVRNWKAALSLPFVHLGVAKDFWKTIDRFREIENGFPSTFFVIPQKDYPGRRGDGPAPWRRAARYDIGQLREEVESLVSAGCEVGLHGIDAWCDSTSGSAEMEAIRGLTDEPKIGVRMHWLYFDEDSPALLDEAGFAYDSTVGYNETVGFRAGTLQAFKPLAADRLLELPMHIMDTALFFPAHLNLSAKQARTSLNEMVEKAVRFGGALTINWHDRSIAPERLWDQPYVELLEVLKSKGAWFATCGQTASWFNKRRSAVIEESNRGPISVARNESKEKQPALRLRLYNDRAAKADCTDQSRFSEVTLDGSNEVEIALSNGGGMARVA